MKVIKDAPKFRKGPPSLHSEAYEFLLSNKGEVVQFDVDDYSGASPDSFRSALRSWAARHDLVARFRSDPSGSVFVIVTDREETTA